MAGGLDDVEALRSRVSRIRESAPPRPGSKGGYSVEFFNTGNTVAVVTLR